MTAITGILVMKFLPSFWAVWGGDQRLAPNTRRSQEGTDGPTRPVAPSARGRFDARPPRRSSRPFRLTGVSGVLDTFFLPGGAACAGLLGRAWGSVPGSPAGCGAAGGPIGALPQKANPQSTQSLRAGMPGPFAGGSPVTAIEKILSLNFLRVFREVW